MNRIVKSALLAGAAWSLLAGAALAQSAPPADTPQDDSSTVEDIIVTARRTEENAQRTPLALTAFSGEGLERAGAQQVTDLQGAVPNLNLVQGRASSNATNIYIRGIGQPDALQTFDPAVGVYVDDVYYSRIRGTQFDLLDLERVEVLRGPQGTLYGKNTIGGALKLVTRRPSEDFRARASIAGGNYDLLDVQGSISGPIATGVAGSLAVLDSQRGGYVTNPNTGEEYNDKNTFAMRGQLSFDPTDRIELDLTADYAYDDAGLTVGQATNSLTNVFGGTVVVIPSPLPEYNFRTAVDPTLPNSTSLKHYGTSARLNWELTDALTLRSITAHRMLEYKDYIDFDATPTEITSALVDVDQNQFSQEFQLNYVSGPVTAVGGVYYLSEVINSHQEAYADAFLAIATFDRFIDDELRTHSRAAYANVSVALTDQLRVSGGIRYTDDNKQYERFTRVVSSNPAFNSSYLFAPPTGSDDDVSFLLSADYQVSDDMMIYGRFSQGFKSGGFNGRANGPTEATAYDAETADTFELGLKSTWLDGRARLNLAAFSTSYKDFQARVGGIENDPVSGLPVAVLSVINAGELKIDGLELEGTIIPIDNLTIDAQIGLLDARYDDFDDSRFTGFGGSRAFQEPAFSPDVTARVGGQYVFDLDGGANVTLGGSAKFRTRAALAVDNTPVNSNVELPGTFQDDYWLYDARVVWNDATDRYTVGLYGQNLSDEVYRTDVQEFSAVGSIRTAYYGAPRTWMVKLTAKY